MGIDTDPTIGAESVAPLFSELAQVLLRTPSSARAAREALLQALLHQFRAEVLCYNEVRLDTRSVSMPVLVSRSPRRGARSPPLDMLCDHPMVRFYCRTGDDEPLRITDVVTRREWERTDVAAALHEQFGVLDQLAIPTAVAPGRVCAWVLMRPEPFSDLDRQLARGMRGVLREMGARRPSPLTHRETDVLRLLSQGLTADAIGRRLLISRHTVAKHLQHIYSKLEVTDRLTAVLAAQHQGLIGTGGDGRTTLTDGRATSGPFRSRPTAPPAG